MCRGARVVTVNWGSLLGKITATILAFHNCPTSERSVRSLRFIGL
jgi:hypothetical protein